MGPIATFFIIFILFIGFPFLAFILSRKARSKSSRRTHFPDDAFPSESSLLDDKTTEHPSPVSSSQESDTFTHPSFPDSMLSFGISYVYKDVYINPAINGHYFADPSVPLTFYCRDNVEIWLHTNIVGTMRDNRLASMIRDWCSSGRYIVAYLTCFKRDDSEAAIDIAFYDDLIQKFIRSHPECKSFILTGSFDDFSPESAYGQKCSISEDFEKEKYEVIVDSCFIGYLPSSAISYAEENSISPDDLNVILSGCDDVDGKLKYSVTVSA